MSVPIDILFECVLGVLGASVVLRDPKTMSPLRHGEHRACVREYNQNSTSSIVG